VRFVLGEVDAGDADLLEAELVAPAADVGSEGGVVGHGAECGRAHAFAAVGAGGTVHQDSALRVRR